MTMRAFVAGAAVTALLGLSPAAAMAQGTTSGTAVGTPVAPSAATQKENPNAQPQAASEQAKEGAMGAGAPGVTAKTATQGGPPPSATAPAK